MKIPMKIQKSLIQLSIGLLFGATAVGLVSCASTSTKTASSQFQLRSFQEETLPNGLRLLFIPDASLPRVSLQMMVRTGSLHDSIDKAGLSALVFGVLDQGTRRKKALELADAFAQIGAEFGAQAGGDASTISASGLATSRSELLQLFNEVVTEASFESAEIERRKSQHLAAIQKALDQPQAYADQVYEATLFEKHPYAVPALGTKESLRSLKRADVVKYYQTWIQPSNSILAVVGQIDAAFMDEVRKTMGQWKSSVPVGQLASRPTVSEGPLRKLVTKKDLKQTQIRIGQLGIRRVDEDFLKLRMASLILGGAFASRLNQRIRDDLGLTYSISANSDARWDRGAFEISTFSRNEKAADTIRETLVVVKDFIQKGATQREIDAAKALMIGQFPSALETPDRLAYNLMILRHYGISDDYLRNFHKNVSSITLDELNSTLQKHVKPDAFRIVVYGDEAVIGQSMKALGDWQIQTAQ